jgi:3-hydroxyethyl bacteriochlorophyllide a dehydrogenase
MVTLVSSSREESPSAGGRTANAVVFRGPLQLDVEALELVDPGEADVVVDVGWSGISTGTERLLWTGAMPPFPGMGYPLVPGYESVGQVRQAGPKSRLHEGDWVFVPGARCFGPVRGLFGGSASRLVVPGDRAMRIDASLEEKGVLLALAATAYHALRPTASAPLPELIVGHGVLGRLLARITVALGGATPTVWERDPGRRTPDTGYPVVEPGAGDSTYRTVFDASGANGILDSLMPRLAHGGEVVLAGFYAQPVAFDFPPAFMREARLRIAAEWKPADFHAVNELVQSGALSLDGLITHRVPADQAEAGYRTAFNEPACLKMILDWSGANAC